LLVSEFLGDRREVTEQLCYIGTGHRVTLGNGTESARIRDKDCRVDGFSNWGDLTVGDSHEEYS
jgi:hypothetical protein